MILRLNKIALQVMIEWLDRHNIERFIGAEVNTGLIRVFTLDTEDFYRLARPVGYEWRQSASVTHLRAVVDGVTITATDEIRETDWIKVAPVSPEDAEPV